MLTSQGQLKISPREALSDADELILEHGHSRHPTVLRVKGDALYNMGNFEHGLLNYYRALHYVSAKVIFT